MCGIAGILAGPTSSPPTFGELRDMIAMLGHRGPDGHGFYRSGQFGLAHARLSLVDLAGAAQPIHNADRTLWLSFNGEIYNFRELRAQLVALGHRFYTQGDGEVIVHCYERYGEAAWRMLNGQFAFALWDGRRRCLWLVRDRMGILPLQFAQSDRHVAFASEAKALFAGGRTGPVLDPAALVEAFALWSVVAPRTVFRGVEMVPPATAICFDARLRRTEQRYWEPSPATLDATTTAEASAALRARLEQAVGLRLEADVPVGVYVSGGLDSSVLAGLAAAQRGDGLPTFSIRFPDARFDETDPQRAVARHLRSAHHETVCDGAAIRAALNEVVWHCEAPLLRASPVPMFLLSRLVRASGIKAVLSGEGADEILGGYTIFKEDRIRRFWARQPSSAMRPALLRRIHEYVGDERTRATPLWQSFFRRGLTETSDPFYSHAVRWANNAWATHLLAPDVRRSNDLGRIVGQLRAAMPRDGYTAGSLEHVQIVEMNTFMAPYLLASQGDRVAMGNAVEVRYPFLDPGVVDFCLAQPARHKLLGTRDKLILRHLARDLLPAAIAARPKRPFRAPIATSLLQEGGSQLDGLLSERALLQSGLIDAAATARLVAKARARDGQLASEREEMGLIGVLTLQSLWQQFGSGFAERVRDARRRLDRSPLHVAEDDQPTQPMSVSVPA